MANFYNGEDQIFTEAMSVEHFQALHVMANMFCLGDACERFFRKTGMDCDWIEWMGTVSIHSAQPDPDSDQKSCKGIPQAKARVA